MARNTCYTDSTRLITSGRGRSQLMLSSAAGGSRRHARAQRPCSAAKMQADRVVGSRPARSFVCGGPRLRVDLWRPPARPLHSRRRWTTSMCSFELEPGARPREDEQVVDEPAQNTIERARIVSARESCSSDGACAGAGGPSFGTRCTRRGQASELGKSSMHLKATSEWKERTRDEVLPVGLTFAALPLAAHDAASRPVLRSRRRAQGRSVSSWGWYPASLAAHGRLGRPGKKTRHRTTPRWS